MEKLARHALIYVNRRIIKCSNASFQAEIEGDTLAELYWNMETAKARYKHAKISKRFLK